MFCINIRHKTIKLRNMPKCLKQVPPFRASTLMLSRSSKHLKKRLKRPPMSVANAVQLDTQTRPI